MNKSPYIELLDSITYSKIHLLNTTKADAWKRFKKEEREHKKKINQIAADATPIDTVSTPPKKIKTTDDVIFKMSYESEYKEPPKIVKEETIEMKDSEYWTKQWRDLQYPIIKTLKNIKLINYMMPIVERPFMEPVLSYDYLFYTIPRGKYFNKKASKLEEIQKTMLEIYMRTHNYSHHTALFYVNHIKNEAEAIKFVFQFGNQKEKEAITKKFKLK